MQNIFKILGLSLLFGWILNLYFFSASNKIIKYWVQPKDINYHDDLFYRFSIVEQSNRKRDFLDIINFGTYKHYEVFISKQSVKPELDYMYGHYKEYGFKVDTDEILAYLEHCEVIWKKEGVWFVEPSGHKIFFPKKSFIGGR